MFTGIIQRTGNVTANRGSLLSIEASLGRLPRGASVAVNGVCLTAVRREGLSWEFDVSAETLRLTNLGGLRPGARVNLELPLKASDFIGGHLVSGHVDACVPILERERLAGGFARLRAALPKELSKLVAYKGSIAVDGVSLTVTRVGRDFFETVLIPETLRATTLGDKGPGRRVNLEADVLARYAVNALSRLKNR